MKKGVFWPGRARGINRAFNYFIFSGGVDVIRVRANSYDTTGDNLSYLHKRISSFFVGIVFR